MVEGSCVIRDTSFLNKDPLHFKADAGMEIFDELLKLHNAKLIHSGQLLNYYKEVPISGPANSIRFEDNKIFCRTNETQSRAIYLSRDTVISFTSLPHDIHAAAHYNTETTEVTLSNLSLVDVLANRRESIRVRMHIPHSVTIEVGPHKINGRLQDLSLVGCAINIADGERLGNFVYMHIQLDVPLKTGLEPVGLRIAANLTKVFQDNKLYTCIFLFDHNKSSEAQIGKIVAMRQMEIIRELK